MQLSSMIAIAALIFISFTIGLNMAFHGVLDRHLDSGAAKSSQGVAETSIVADAPVARKTEVAEAGLSRGQSRAPDRRPPPPPPPPPPSRPPPPTPKPPPPPPPPPVVPHALTADISSVRLKLSEVLGSGPSAAALDAARQALRASSKPAGPIHKFLSQGGELPVLLLASSRAKQLQQTLSSLFAVRGISKANVIVIQDGVNAEVAMVVRQAGLTLIQNRQGLELEQLRQEPVDGAEKIARHYKFALSTAFEHYPSAPALIVVEDDLLFSPDFYEYFAAVAPVLNLDPSLFVVSAWNDNGFRGKVQDPLGLARTEFFPGLGWLLPRALYKGELEMRWPDSHWDHWLRSPAVHRNREIVYPQVPRTFHNGVFGTFMNMETHNRYFRNIDYNTDRAVAWLPRRQQQQQPSASAYVGVMRGPYEARIHSLLQACTHVASPAELMSGAAGIYCVWIKVEPEPAEYERPAFEPVATFFGLWHEHKRSAHRGLHEFFWEGSYVLLLNIFDCGRDRINGPPGVFLGSYLEHMPPSARVVPPGAFDHRLLVEARRRRLGVVGHVAKEAGTSCHTVCADKGLRCSPELLPLVNTCEALKEAFACRRCVGSVGREQPAFVVPEAEEQFGPGKCLVSFKPEQSSCDAAHKATRRLCACVP